MSDEAIIALAAVIVSGVVGLATLGFNFWNASSERKQRTAERKEDFRQWYKRALFEKRLEAAREAYEWLMKLNRALNLADPTDQDHEWTLKLRAWCLESRDWYDGNALYLYGALPQSSEFIGLMNAASNHAVGVGGDNSIWKHYMGADKEIRQRLKEVMSDVGIADE